ncbi:hypothetical protein H671_20842 [Cricetulus griseus]|nr:hypothetical protein H671_20842 [Cricetulus griseus]
MIQPNYRKPVFGEGQCHLKKIRATKSASAMEVELNAFVTVVLIHNSPITDDQYLLINPVNHQRLPDALDAIERKAYDSDFLFLEDSLIESGDFERTHDQM